MGISYHIPANIQITGAPGHPALINAQGGKIIVDQSILDIWQGADRKDLKAILDKIPSRPEKIITRAALACLAEAGLLIRDNQQELKRPKHNPSQTLVSVIIVNHNTQRWLKTCIPSLIAQSHKRLEIIIVDNASNEPINDWLEYHYDDKVRLIQLHQSKSLAYAINLGAKKATGRYYLLLNPDTTLHYDAVAQLVSAAESEQNCAAVAAKLRLLKTPAFLNGIGNYVGAISWGGDNALGYLDIGQFDNWRQIPSACFAAALIPTTSWKAVGPLDENFPLYYEDSEWCYRGRLLGQHVLAAPHAVVYHAFGGQPENLQLKSEKLQAVVFGRLRFVTKLLSFPSLVRFMISYILEDIFRFMLALARGHWQANKAYLLAWKNFLQEFVPLLAERQKIQAQRKISDSALFQLQRHTPTPLLWNGIPQLTWDLVRNVYLPQISTGNTRSLPEFQDQETMISHQMIGKLTIWQRGYTIWKQEGLASLAHKIGKTMQQLLARPY